ncbi:DUF4291 domain-containing protein [Chondromyces crocatus]|nr:DUF4291 domain-containing protein [Chondromyces crocatus]
MGRALLAQHDETSVIVYQAYHPRIGRAAASTGRFGEGWSRTRMSWIKPSFLWMMFRSGWGTKQDQEVVLAIRMKREGFDWILKEAVHSSYAAEVYGTREAWASAVRRSDVRLQWDPDHAPGGAKVERRAIQLGLRGQALAHFADEWIVGLEDISGFVAEQRRHAQEGDFARLVTPREKVYPVMDPAVARKLGLKEQEGSG